MFCHVSGARRRSGGRGVRRSHRAWGVVSLVLLPSGSGATLLPRASQPRACARLTACASRRAHSACWLNRGRSGAGPGRRKTVCGRRFPHTHSSTDIRWSGLVRELFLVRDACLKHYSHPERPASGSNSPVGAKGRWRSLLQRPRFGQKFLRDPAPFVAPTPLTGAIGAFAPSGARLVVVDSLHNAVESPAFGFVTLAAMARAVRHRLQPRPGESRESALVHRRQQPTRPVSQFLAPSE